MVSSAHLVWKPAARPTFAGPALLDTHVWVWLLEGDLSRLSSATVPLLQRCLGSDGGGLVVCDISWWEVAVKCAKGKLTLSLDVALWLRRAEQAPRLRLLPLDRSILVASTQLPGSLHGDPADRMLLAAAQLESLPLITADRHLVEYARTQRTFPVCDARR